VVGQYVRAFGAGAIRHREDGDLILRDTSRQFRSRAFVVHPAHPVQLRMIDRIALMSDPLARALAGFPEEFLVRFDHTAEAGGTRTAEDTDNLLALSPDGHLVETERPAKSATRTRMVAEHVGDHLVKAGWRMDPGNDRVGR